MIPESEWVWCGYPGHFIGGKSCLLHLHTRVGAFRISTIGDYYPNGPDGRRETVGYDRYYETFVFHVADHGEHGEGNVTDWSEIDMLGSNEPLEAERNHMTMCRKYAAEQGGHR